MKATTKKVKATTPKFQEGEARTCPCWYDRSSRTRMSSLQANSIRGEVVASPAPPPSSGRLVAPHEVMEVGDEEPSLVPHALEPSSSPGRCFLTRLLRACWYWVTITWASSSGSRGSLQSPMVIPLWHWLQPGSGMNKSSNNGGHQLQLATQSQISCPIKLSYNRKKITLSCLEVEMGDGRGGREEGGGRDERGCTWRE